MSIISSLPFTLTDGTVADATQVMADLNQIRNDVNNNAQPKNNTYSGAAVFTTSSQNVTSGGYTIVNFDTKIIDTNSIANLILHPTRLTVPVGAAWIRLLSQIYINPGSPTDSFYFQILKNGSIGGALLLANNSVLANSFAGQAVLNLTGFPMSVTPGDYFEIEVGSSTSGATIGHSTTNSWFEMQIIG